MKNLLLNLLSRYYGKQFAKNWKSSRLYQSHKCLKYKAKYIATRQKLPVLECGNHLGNHKGSKYKPFLATQGC
jgi:hypothetical protein